MCDYFIDTVIMKKGILGRAVFSCKFNNSATLPLNEINEDSQFSPAMLPSPKRASFKYKMSLPSLHPSFMLHSPCSAHPDHRF